MSDFPPALLNALRAAQHIAVLTGAGMSAESGVPTFREAQTGLWARYDPQELATAEAFLRNPRLVWEWYAWRRELVNHAEPNSGHVALARLENVVSRLTLVTQNVDSLHQRAGSRNVIELHGNLVRTRCFDAGHVVDAWPESEDVPPPCPRCGSPLRPDVVWFGESLPPGALDAAVEATHDCDLFLSIGTSTAVYPAAALPFEALQAGATVVEVNPGETALTRYASFVVGEPAGKALPALFHAAWPERDF